MHVAALWRYPVKSLAGEQLQQAAVTTDGLHVGAGGGVAVRLLRSTIFTFTLARGSDGAEFNIDSGWMF